MLVDKMKHIIQDGVIMFNKDMHWQQSDLI